MEDTDEGAALRERVVELARLIEAYDSGLIAGAQ